jgi:hypothetical protein
MPKKDVAMERLVQVDRVQMGEALRQEAEQMLRQVMDAVNAARDGRLIEDSEGPVLEIMQEFQRRLYEKALQMRIDSTESSFSPSEGHRGSAQAH